jgi:hypothetical protein
MESSHYLIGRAHVYPHPGQISDPENCRYDDRLGVWRWGEGKDTVLVKSSNPQRPRPQSKKHDIETGEDLKGE